MPVSTEVDEFLVEAYNDPFYGLPPYQIPLAPTKYLCCGPRSTSQMHPSGCLLQGPTHDSLADGWHNRLLWRCPLCQLFWIYFNLKNDKLNHLNSLNPFQRFFFNFKENFILPCWSLSCNKKLGSPYSLFDMSYWSQNIGYFYKAFLLTCNFLRPKNNCILFSNNWCFTWHHIKHC